MSSALYAVDIAHVRAEPVRHDVRHSSYLWFVDLDDLPSYGPLARFRGRGPRTVPGTVLAVEPMLTLGRPETHELDDGWTAVTDDGSLACHFEHTVAVTPDGLWVLTATDGGKAELAARGAPYAPL